MQHIKSKLEISTKNIVEMWLEDTVYVVGLQLMMMFIINKSGNYFSNNQLFTA